ncbi:hypothetical protein [Jiangella muralis]|uniref:hypothetical protein n=1 Tax=Jiangella muralis TaxID=702383 RepID=UPI00069D1E80|nr:hypothetical protein [Jiangella muralis]
MIPRTKDFARYIGTWFDTTDSADMYVEACERAPQRLAEDADGSFRAIRDELAVHVRDSSYPPLPNSSQWATDEWLRDLWYDVFGPEAPPGDPYPVPAGDWGTTRLTTYMLHAVDEDEEGSSAGAAAWLAARALTARGVYDAISAETVRRPEPDGYADRLRRLADAGLREQQP